LTIHKPRNILSTVGRYIVGGLVATITHILILLLLVEKFSVDSSIATSVGFCVAVFVNYNFQYHWTFASTGPHSRVFSRYISVTIVMLVVNLILFRLLSELVGIPYIYAQLVAIAAVTLCNFTINKLYTFRRR
jgi:putative flippase GtrA